MKYNFIVNKTTPLILILNINHIKMKTIKIHWKIMHLLTLNRHKYTFIIWKLVYLTAINLISFQVENYDWDFGPRTWLVHNAQNQIIFMSCFKWIRACVDVEMLNISNAKVYPNEKFSYLNIHSTLVHVHGST